MSNEAFHQFLAELQSDESLREEVKAAGGEQGVPVAAMAAIAATKGYEFTVEDVSSELEDTELEGVTGGLDLSRTVSPDWKFHDVAVKVELVAGMDYIKDIYLKIT